MKKISTLALGLLVGLTSLNSNALKIADNLPADKLASARTALDAAENRAAEVERTKILEAIGTGNGILIAPRLYLTTASVTPAIDNVIRFHDANGVEIESGTLIRNLKFQSPATQPILGDFGMYFDPGANYAVYVFEKPITKVAPIPYNPNKKYHYDQSDAQDYVAYFKTTGNKKAAIEFDCAVDEQGDLSKEGKVGFFRLTLRNFQDDVLKFENRDAAAPLINIDDDGNATVMGIWSSSPNAPSIQKNAYNFTCLGHHSIDLDKVIAEYGPLKVYLAESASRAIPHLIRGVGIAVAGGMWTYGQFKLDYTSFDEGVYHYLATPSGQGCQDTLVVNKHFNGTALKIDNVKNQVRVQFQKQDNLLIEARDSANTVLTGTVTDGKVIFDEVPYGLINFTFTIEGLDPIQVTYSHNQN